MIWRPRCGPSLAALDAAAAGDERLAPSEAVQLAEVVSSARDDLYVELIRQGRMPPPTVPRAMKIDEALRGTWARITTASLPRPKRRPASGQVFRTNPQALLRRCDGSGGRGVSRVRRTVFGQPTKSAGKSPLNSRRARVAQREAIPVGDVSAMSAMDAHGPTGGLRAQDDHRNDVPVDHLDDLLLELGD
jgi:hypothetical protein